MKIHIAMRALGTTLPFILSFGRRGNYREAHALIDRLSADFFIADTTQDAAPFRETIAEKNAIAVIPNNRSRAKKLPIGKLLYAHCCLIECRFSKLKQFRRVAKELE
ncbi:MAG: hypothetical protein INF79_04525 [Roseomonas sp.]|nr:hypothetical protein [Roseomonas sp.]MCA3364864.1 hypothetical protein [Roseomonas sp.]MCA3380409.1 hypothetical protein [Roseomonas sp.]